MKFLETWLDPWTEERAAANDYRILYCDVAKSHVGDAPLEFAWSRGYMMLYHYGNTTGVAQVNDTANWRGATWRLSKPASPNAN